MKSKKDNIDWQGLGPKYKYGRDEAPPGKKWVRNIMTKEWMLEDEDTPYSCSVASEAYWSS